MDFCVFFSYNLLFIFVTVKKKIFFLLTEDKVTLWVDRSKFMKWNEMSFILGHFKRKLKDHPVPLISVIEKLRVTINIDFS